MPKRKRLAAPAPAVEDDGDFDDVDAPMQEVNSDDDGSDSEYDMDSDKSDGEQPLGDEDTELLALLGRDSHASTAQVLSKILGNNVSANKKQKIMSKSKEVMKELEREREEQKKRKTIADAKQEAAKAKREFALRFRRQPEDYAIGTEQKLLKTATRGAVTLFNAVKKQQRAEQSKSEEMSKMSKQSFLDMLKSAGKKPGNEEPDAGELQEPSSVAPGWDVLKDDYMVGSSIKEWHKVERELEAEQEASEAEEEYESE